MTFDPEKISYVPSIDDVRGRHPSAMSRATDKVLTTLDKHCRAILERSTFCLIGTQGPHGGDVSPRGDPAGFVRVLDDKHILLPDRIGNNRFNSMANLFVNPMIGMLFLVPGMSETLRLNGLGRVTDDAELLAASAVQQPRAEGRHPDRNSGSVSPLRQIAQPRRPLGSGAPHQPQRTAELW